MANENTRIIISAVDQTGAAVQAAEANIKRLSDTIDKVPGFGPLAASLAAIGSVAALKNFITDTINATDSLNDLKDMTGASIENLSALKSVAALNGHEFGNVEAGLVKLSKALRSSDDESKGAARALEWIGLSIKDLRDLDPAEAMLQISKALQENAVQADHAALATAIWGKEGAKLLPYLKDLAEQQTLVGKVTEEQADQAERYNKNVMRLQGTMSSWAKSLAMEVLPKLTEFSTQLLLGLKYSDGLFDAISKYGLTNPFKSQDERVRDLSAEAQKLEDKISIGRGTAADEKQLAGLQKQLAYYKELDAILNKRDEKSSGRSGWVATVPKEKQAKESRELDWEGKIQDRVNRAEVKAAEIYTDAVNKTDGRVADIQAKIDQLGKTPQEIARMQAFADIDKQFKAAEEQVIATLGAIGDTEGIDRAVGELRKLADEAKENTGRALDELHQKQLDLNATWEFGATEALRKYGEQARNVAGQTEQAMTRSFGAMEDALVEFAKTGKINFRSFADVVVSEIIRIQVRAQVAKAVAGVSGWFSGLFGGSAGSSGGEMSGATDVNAVSTVGVAHGGALVGQYFTGAKSVPDAVFQGAPRYHGGGLVAGEVPAILQTGERVLSRSETAAYDAGKSAGASMPPITFNLINKTGEKMAATNGGMRMDMGQMVVDVVLDRMTTDPNFRQAMRS